MANPLTPQGTLNRLVSSVIWDDFADLDVTPPFLGEGAISVTFEGATSTQINTLTGAVQSPEPYQTVSMSINLLRTQSLADDYKTQLELNVLLGNCTVRGDARQMGPWNFINCAIEGVDAVNFAGKTPGYVVRIKGYYYINSNLFNLG